MKNGRMVWTKGPSGSWEQAIPAPVDRATAAAKALELLSEKAERRVAVTLANDHPAKHEGKPFSDGKFTWP